MTASEIVSLIIAWNKDREHADVVELLASRAKVSDLPFIHDALEPHVSGNEYNCARGAVAWIEAQGAT